MTALGSNSRNQEREGSEAVNRIAGSEAERVFVTCSCVPEEIITAAGLRAERLLPSNPPAEADSHIHPNTCGYLKSLLASALDEAGERAACIAIGNGCDGMRKLYDLWGAYAKRIPALLVDPPRKKDPDSIGFFASELRRFANGLETVIPGVTVTEEGLRSAIRAHNRVRLLMGEVFALQRDPRTSVGGREVFELSLEGTRCPPEQFIPRLEDFLSRVKEREPASSERRFLLTGNPISRPDPLAMIEELGGRVVALDTCTGQRHYETLVEEDAADPIMALATRYLTRPACPRMEGLEQRFEYLEKLAEAARADGIVYCCVKFCDPLIYDLPMMSRWFRAAGISFLYLENDYTWSGSGQMKTRLQAFTELEARVF